MESHLVNIAYQWFAAFNEHDLGKLLLLYDEHAQHFSPRLRERHPETNGLIIGKEHLRRWWQDAFERLPSLKYEMIRLTPFEDRIFLEYTRHVDGERELYVGEMLEVSDGKIYLSTVFHR